MAVFAQGTDSVPIQGSAGIGKWPLIIQGATSSITVRDGGSTGNIIQKVTGIKSDGTVVENISVALPIDVSDYTTVVAFVQNYTGVTQYVDIT